MTEPLGADISNISNRLPVTFCLIPASGNSSTFCQFYGSKGPLTICQFLSLDATKHKCVKEGLKTLLRHNGYVLFFALSHSLVFVIST